MAKKEGFKCVLCGSWSLGWGSGKKYGNNPEPLASHGECCNECNAKVIKARLERARNNKTIY